ncbi:DNA gyrase/topoisomerase IV subunit A [Urbifossiella limnaea]|uniref:DNA topoisomerase (ATP-hydrolyzing) n=1 Tax=Urbifossiella limnaea TaxID=2528023 RepID=A0A517XVC2_9BACT|nr:DNA topoisomerase (ATP-hydrolyzing) [Urbifossiella limnaea]QDU21437.1 DNA gyrase subunit A [Urbifossiella limnaea]
MAGVQTVSIAQEVRTRFIRYAMSVVTGRALPDVRDGLKPVQRRILFTMYNDSNLTFDRKAAKSAQIVGDVMGRYHPHGDGAIYDAMVRLSQEWVMRVPLVHGEGNFGSVDGDPPAAYRYTEAKLSAVAGNLLGELDFETIDYRDNYAGNRREPVVLPAQFPNLLVNGTSGIAVGMATNIPPHNFAEVLKACVVLIDNPDATVAVLMEKVKGPDFPLGGKIVTDRATLRKIYETGSGSIKVQGEWKEEDLGRGKSQIVVTSIPYGVDKGELEKTIGGMIEDRKLPQLLGLSNETNDKEGLRITLELRPNTDPALVMAYLYKHTDLQKNFAYNMTALVPLEDGKTMVPRDGLSLKDILQHFLDFRFATVKRRFEYHLRVLRRRIHILEGFAVIFNALDRAIKLIRESSGKADAAEKLKAAFKLDDEQTTAVLDAQLYKIAQMEIQKILEELAEKRKEAAKIEAILASKKKLWGVIRDEFEALTARFPERRKTRMAQDEDVLEFDEEAYIVRENANVVLTRNGWLKRVGRLQSVESTRVKEGDEVVAVIPASTLDHVAFFTDDGAAYTMRVNEVPATTGHGEPITKYFKLADGAKVIAAVTTDPRFTPADVPDGGPYLLVATSAGNVLRIPVALFRTESTKAGRRFVKLDDGDKAVMAKLVGAETGVMLASAGGHLIHFSIDSVNVVSGAAKGVIGIKVEGGDTCIGGVLVGGRFDKLQLETEAGKEQEFGPGAIKVQNRGGKGEKPGVRTKFARVLPPPIELVNWDELDGKAPRKAAEGDGASA